MWPLADDVIHVARFSPRCTVLGPGARAVLWVQGCPFRCHECVALETLPFSGGHSIRVPELADLILTRDDIEGVTFSGGEPMMQAPALHHLMLMLRQSRNLSAMSYTGFTLQHLQERPPPGAANFLAQLDILIDGPYLPEQHCDLLWRGSGNQQIHFLSPRYAAWASRISDRAHQIEIEVSPDGSLGWMGIPPRGFRDRFEKSMKRQGIEIQITTSP